MTPRTRKADGDASYIPCNDMQDLLVGSPAMPEPDEPDTEPAENVYEVSLEASGEVAPGLGQTAGDVPAQDEE